MDGFPKRRGSERSIGMGGGYGKERERERDFNLAALRARMMETNEGKLSVGIDFG
jgi:hypothetical protein